MTIVALSERDNAHVTLIRLAATLATTTEQNLTETNARNIGNLAAEIQKIAAQT